MPASTNFLEPAVADARSIFFAVAVLIVGLAAPCTAQSRAVDELIREGVGLRQAGDDTTALQRFQAAYAIEPTPRALAQIGLCEFALSRWVDSEEHLRLALSETRDEWIARNRDALTTSYQEVRGHVATVRFTGPAGTQLSVAGRALTLPATPIRVVAGATEVSATAAGYQPLRQIFQLRGAETTHIQLAQHLLPIQPEATAPEMPIAPAPAQPSHSVTDEGWFWPVVLGVAAVGVGVAATVYFVTNPIQEQPPDGAHGHAEALISF